MNRPLPHLTLTEAITILVLGRALSADDLIDAMTNSSVGMSRPALYRAAETAASILCNAGLEGHIEFWGIRASGEHCAGPISSGKKEQFVTADFLNYRHYLLGHDALWHVPPASMAHAIAAAGEPEAATVFAAFSAADCCRDVELKRLSFESFRKQFRGSVQKPFTTAERHRWIVACSEAKCDAAYRLFKADPKWDGTKQTAFRGEWRNLRKPAVGRPRKSR